jgi:HEAT repeat protein
MFGWLQQLLGSLFAPDVPPLVRQARSPDALVRRQAAVELGTVLESWAAELLLSLLEDTHSAVREAAGESLRRLGPASVSVLLEGLNHANPQVGQAAAELLGEFGHPRSVGPLLTALKYAPRPVQVACKRALIRLGSVAVPALEAAREEPQPWVRRQIEDILAAVAGASESTSGQEGEVS